MRLFPLWLPVTFNLFVRSVFSEDELRTERLLEWCYGKGATLGEHVSIVHAGLKGSGVAATHFLDEGSIVTSTPLQPGIVVHVSDALSSLIDGGLDAAILDQLNDQEVLATFLCFEVNDKRSSWAKYLSALPVQVNSPLGWSVADLKALDNTLLRQEVSDRRERLASVSRLLSGAGFHVSFSTMAWAITIVTSRTHSVQIRDTGGRKWRTVKLLVPLADIINYSVDHNVACSTEEVGGAPSFICRTSREVQEGEELTARYSRSVISNAELLLDYGFVRPFSTDYSSLRVRLPFDGLSSSALLARAASAILGSEDAYDALARGGSLIRLSDLRDNPEIIWHSPLMQVARLHAAMNLLSVRPANMEAVDETGHSLKWAQSVAANRRFDNAAASWLFHPTNLMPKPVGETAIDLLGGSPGKDKANTMALSVAQVIEKDEAAVRRELARIKGGARGT